MQCKISYHTHLIENDDHESCVCYFVDYLSTGFDFLPVVGDEVVGVDDVSEVNEDRSCHRHNWHGGRIVNADCENCHYLCVEIPVAEGPCFRTPPWCRIIEHFSLLESKFHNKVSEHHIWDLKCVEHYGEDTLL